MDKPRSSETATMWHDVIKKHVIIFCKAVPLSPEPTDRASASNESYGSVLMSPSRFFLPPINAIESLESPPGAFGLKSPPKLRSPFASSVASAATKFSIETAVVSDESLQRSLEKVSVRQTEDFLFEDIFSGDIGTSGYGTYRTPDFSTEFQNSLTQKKMLKNSQSQKSSERQLSETLFKTPKSTVDYSTEKLSFGEGPSKSLSHSSGYGTFEMPRKLTLQPIHATTSATVTSQMAMSNESDMDIDVELTQRPVINEFQNLEEHEEIPDSVTIPESPECQREDENIETKVSRCQSPDIFASTDDEHVSPTAVLSGNSELSPTYENFSQYLSPVARNVVLDTSFRSKHSTPVFQRPSQCRAAPVECQLYQEPEVYEPQVPELALAKECAASDYHPLFHHFFTQELDAMNDEPEDVERVYGQSCP
jgi:hypothetical protein